MKNPRIPRYGLAKLREGEKYEQFVHGRLSPWGLTFWVNNDPLFQLKGESLQGCEVKLDNRCTDTGRLSIEVAEKSDPSLLEYTASGIHKVDNSWIYIQGNYSIIFVFSKKWLIRYEDHVRPHIKTEPTLKAWYLPFNVAMKGCLFALDGAGKRID